MNSVRISYWRAATALLCAVLLLVVSVAASTHGHADPTQQHACTLCQFEHSPADIDQSGPLISPPVPLHAAVFSAAVTPDISVQTVASGRAPPVHA